MFKQILNNPLDFSSLLTNGCWLYSTSPPLWTGVMQLLPGRAAGQSGLSYVWARNTLRGRAATAWHLQEVTLMKNSVVCSSWCPSGMNKARPRQREKTWAQLETTRWPTVGEHTRWLALGDGPELNFNRASDRLNDMSGVSISRCSLCLRRPAPFWTRAKWNTHRFHFSSCRLALWYLKHATKRRKNCTDARHLMWF